MTQCPSPARLFAQHRSQFAWSSTWLCRLVLYHHPTICLVLQAFKTRTHKAVSFDSAAGADTGSPISQPRKPGWPCGPTHTEQEQDRHGTSSLMSPSPVVLPPRLLPSFGGGGLGKLCHWYFISLKIGAFEFKTYVKWKKRKTEKNRDHQASYSR